MDDGFWIRQLVESVMIGGTIFVAVSAVAIRIAAKPFLDARRLRREEAAAAAVGAGDPRVRVLEAEIASMQLRMRLLEETHDFDRQLARSAREGEAR